MNKKSQYLSYGIGMISMFFLGFTLLLSSCEKEEDQRIMSDNMIETASTMDSDNGIKSESKDNGNVQAQGGLCVCNGYTLQQDPQGEWGCPSGTGCAKIQTCPCDLAVAGSAGSAAFDVATYFAFNDALVSNNLPGYFGTTAWQGLFPQLFDQPSVLADLQSGLLTVIEVVNTDNSLVEVVVPSYVGSAWVQDDVVLSVNIPAGIVN